MYSRKAEGIQDRNHGLLQICRKPIGYGPDYSVLAKEYINKNGYVRYWDDEAKAPWLFNGSTFISYDDPESMRCKAQYGSRLAFAADEFYLKAGLPLPDEDYYEDYPQIENGVGLWKSLECEFQAALETCDLPADTAFAAAMATGTASFPLLRSFKALLESRFQNARVDVYAIENDFFGHSITVAGLVTGQDLIAQLKGKDLHGRLLIPSVMLRAEGDVFLDDVSVKDVERALGVRLVVVNNDGAELLDAIIAEQ